MKKEKTFETPQEENAYLRKQNAGLRGYCRKLEQEIERFKRLDKEGDELNEKRLAECENYLAALSTKDKVITELTKKLQRANEKNIELTGDNSHLRDEYGKVKAFMALPWYKRIFAK